MELLDNDTTYLVRKFHEVKNKALEEIRCFYDFLQYFFIAIKRNIDGTYYCDNVVGRILAVGPTIFSNDLNIESVNIPDECFYRDGLTNALMKCDSIGPNFNIPLLNLLESWNWTDANIDWSVIGGIFERLITLEERKSSGAFYTPQNITHYMCETVVHGYLIEHLNEAFNENFHTLNDVISASQFEILQHLLDLLRRMRILDPSVGVGHFLESAVDVLVNIYKTVWNQVQRLSLKQRLDIRVADESGRLKIINLFDIENESRFILYVMFFIILPRNIYGVDINSSALEIARAGLFLTLVKQFKNVSNDDELIRLPNVKLNLKCGNSLVGYACPIDKVSGECSFRPPNSPKSSKRRNDQRPNDRQIIMNAIDGIDHDFVERLNRGLTFSDDIFSDLYHLANVLRQSTMNSDDLVLVLQIKKKLIMVLNASLATKHAPSVSTLLDKITNLFNHVLDQMFSKTHKINYNKLQSLHSIPWNRKMFHWTLEFPEIIHEDGGFDVIIGNPPYGRFKQIVKDNDEKEFLLKMYGALFRLQKGNLNLYKLFLERSYSLLRNKGYCSMIFPSSFLGESSSVPLRRLFFKSCRVLKILEFPENARVFEGMTQAVCILLYVKESKDDYQFQICTNISEESKRRLDDLKFLELNLSDIDALTTDYRVPIFSNPEMEWSILNQIAKFPRFGLSNKDRSLTIGEGQLHETFDSEYMSPESGDTLLVKGIHLDRFFVNLDPNGPVPRWLRSSKEFFARKPEARRNIHLERIIGRSTLNKASKPRLRFALLEPGYMITNNVKFIVLSNNNINKFYLIALLNSSLLNWRFELFSLQNRINNYEIETLPIPRVSPNEQKPFSILAKHVLLLKQFYSYQLCKGRNLSRMIDFFDSLLDAIVYELYLKEEFGNNLLNYISGKIPDVDYIPNILQLESNELKNLLERIVKVFETLFNDVEIMSLLNRLFLHPWIKHILGTLGHLTDSM